MNKILQFTLLFSSVLSFSQEQLRGKYCSNPIGESGVVCIDFKKQNHFEYSFSDCLGISRIGTGVFELHDRTLRLTFDKKEQPTRTIVKVKKLTSNSEKIEFKFVITDENGFPLYAKLIEQPKVKSFEIYKENNTIEVDKKESTVNYRILSIGYEVVELELNHISSKLIEVTMFPVQAEVISEEVFEWNLTKINTEEFKIGPEFWHTYRKIKK